MAELFWPGQSPLGRRIKLFDRENNAREAEIVGTVRNSKYRSFGEAPRPVIYLPATQWYRADMRIQVTTSGDPVASLPLVRTVLRELDPDLPATITTLREELAFSLVPAKVAGGILAAAGGIGLLLAAMGLFGIVSYQVARQAHEIGIRMALGARSGQIAASVVRRGVRLTATGLAIGLAASAGLAQLLRGLLFGIGATDPLSFGIIAMILFATCLLACWLPAGRAARVDPMVVLREE
jgi:ABC-type antimicrobial peptide transport system permease subunit